MPYIKEHNLIFIHIPKTGGTSIEKKFGMYHQWDYDKLIHRRQEVINDVLTAPQHWTPNLIIDKLGKAVYDKCIKFTVVRNPYHRVLSEYFYKTRNSNLNKFNDWFFDYYSCIDNDHKLPQHYFVDDSIDFIARTETLQSDFDLFVKKYNLNIDSKLPHVNKSLYNTRNTIYSLNQNAISKINEIYKKDFELFNYPFIDNTNRKPHLI